MTFQDLLLERIQSLPKLTPGEARIADYFQRNRSSLAFETATSISRRTGLSKATVVRFVSRLGYDGFPDFQEKLQSEFMELVESPIKRYSDTQNVDESQKRDYLGSAVNSAIGNLQEIQDRNDAARFDKVAQLLATNPGRVYVLGLLTSFGLAQIFWSLVNYLRPGVILLDNRYSSLPNQLVNVVEEDVLLAITHRRYSQQTDLTIHHFSNLGAKVVLLTDSALNPIATLADHVLVSPSNGPFLFDSHSTALTLIECLAAAMADHLEPKIRNRFQIMDALFKHYGAFSPGIDYNLAQRVRSHRTKQPDQTSRTGESRE